MFDGLDITGHPWLDIALVAIVFALAASVVHRIAMAANSRYARNHPIVARLFSRTHLPGTVVLWSGAFDAVLQMADSSLPNYGVVHEITTLVLIASITWLGVRVVAAIVDALVLFNPANVDDNLHARRVQTQARVLGRIVVVFVVVVGIASALMTFPGVRQIGTSLLASAGVAGLVAGLAARPVLSNLISGMQIALTQPIRIDDVLVVENEWGRVEEIRDAYVVLKLWDERRLIVPLQWFIEHPFQNWTRSSAELIGTVFLWVDFRTALDSLRSELLRICRTSPEWDARVAVLQVTDTSEHAMQVRVLVSSANSDRNFDLRCKVREGLIDFLQREQPDALPRLRASLQSFAPRVAVNEPATARDVASVGG